MRRVLIFGVVFLLAAFLVQGCAILERLNVDDAQEFGRWVLVNYDPATDEWSSKGRLITLTKPDGTQRSREMPEDVSPDDLQRILVGLRRSAETGSPWPAVFGVAGSALSILFGAFARQKSKEAKGNKIRAVQRTRQLEAAVRGIESADVEPASKRLVAKRVQREAKLRGVEDGPDGLAAHVQAMAADVSNA